MLLKILTFFLLLWLAAIAGVWIVSKRILSWFKQSNSNPQTKAHATGRSQPKAESDKLVECATCSTYIPADQAIYIDENSAYFCSEDCLEQKTRYS